jgi:sulfopyruvate decarboxylase TPP-binding subunit
MTQTHAPVPAWQEAVFTALKKRGVQQIAYVPDSGHSHVIREAQRGPAIHDVVLTTEEEGVAVVSGVWLGGQRAVQALELMGITVVRADAPEGVEDTAEAALDSVFESGERVAVLLGQKLIGRKKWERD